MTPRVAAAEVLGQVMGRGRSLADALPPVLATQVQPRDRALCQELCFGTLRWYRRLDAIARQLLDRPLRDRDQPVQWLILVGLYQLIETAIPAHAAVSETVKAAGALRRPWATRLVNAVLRRFQREAEALLAAVDADPAARYAVPDWLLRCVRDDWPADWQDALTACNQRPPMTLRVNAQRTTRAAYLHRLGDAGITARLVPGTDAALTLERSVPVNALPGFHDGDVSVQDAAAQLAAALLGAQCGERVLDACAAPGGKTAHLLERTGVLELIAVDNDPARRDRLVHNLSRLRLQARTVVADATQTAYWWDGHPFDRILLDAPCSGTGVIRRHPDIKWLRRADDVGSLAVLQSKLLDALWPLLAPGGRLIYATCSWLRCENETVVAGFLSRKSDARSVAPALPVGRPLVVGHQILPGEAGMDGFYYAWLEKD